MNVHGETLKACSLDPVTGWNRDGFCRYRPEDGGKHLVCATMSDDFLEYTKSQGNDLSTPSGSFPGLKAGDNWCICAGRYSQAASAGHAPEVVLDATNKEALRWKLVQDILSHKS